MNNNNNTPWWAQNLPDSERIKPHQENSGFKPIPSITTLAWVFILAIGSLSVMWSLNVLSPPVGRNIEFGGYEYYTDVSTINSQCTNIFVFGDSDPEGIITLEDAETESSFETYDKYIREAKENAAKGGGLITAKEEARAFYIRYPVPRHVVTIPVSGYMFAEGLDLDNRTVGPETFIPIETIMRSMFDGAIIVWYNPSDLSMFDIAKKYVEDNPSENIFVMPWNYSLSMAEDKNLAISTWNASMECSVWSETAMEEFSLFTKEHPETRPKTALPPTAPIKESNGTLYPITLLPAEINK